MLDNHDRALGHAQRKLRTVEIEAGSTAADKYGVYYQNTWHFTPQTADSAGTSLTLALDHERQDFRQRGAVIVIDPDDPSQDLDPNQDQDMSNTAVVRDLLLRPFARTSLSRSGRYDDNSDFDWTSRLSPLPGLT